ncbi:MAG: SLC13 family permease, partial [Verrucomicrobiales bacterium]
MPDRALELRMAAVALLMATWWITEAVPLAATSLVPLAMLPLLGILSGKDTATQYFNDTIVLYLGGFLLALAMERWDLHRRVALTIVGALGGSPQRLVLGFLLASGGISMWISNTATAIMMVAIGLAVARQVEAQFGEKAARPLAIGLLLA